MKSNATTYRIEGELRDWIRDTSRKENISQTTLVRFLLEFFRQEVVSGRCSLDLVHSEIFYEVGYGV